MYAAGEIIVLNGNTYEYVCYDESLKMHKLSEVDNDGFYYVPKEELKC